MTFLKALLVGVLLCASLTFGWAMQDGPLPAVPQGETARQKPSSSNVRVDVDLVLLHAAVTDSANRHIDGLGLNDFRVWEDKIEQRVEYVSSETIPLSAGIILDVSGSMEDKLDTARAAAEAFLKMGDQDDEYFLIQFSDAPQLVQDFTTDIDKLRARLLAMGAHGSTSLYDALYLGIEKVMRGRNSRKALILITDGQDNHSRYSFSDLKEFAREHDVAIYCIGIEDSFDFLMYGIRGRTTLQSLAELTGGNAFFPRAIDTLPGICAQIGLELKHQYVLGYRSLNPSADGKWRRVQVKVARPKGMASVRVRAKTGYYAPKIARVAQ
jgi:Ca-activated chloride channel family protein